ncbi:MAG: hypothetical protein KHW87_00710 [Clostridiales bacterium]|nr:hypothetical protein [Clostridiales bacterium]
MLQYNDTKAEHQIGRDGGVSSKKWFGIFQRIPIQMDVLRYILHMLFCLIIIAFEIGFLPHIRLFGAHGMLLYGLCCSIGYFESARVGAVFGAGIGLISGLLYGQQILFLPLTLALCGGICGKFSAAVFRHRYLTWLCCLLLSLIIQGVASAIFITVRWWAFEPLLLLQLVGGELILSLCICHLLYLPQKALSHLRKTRLY